MTRDDTRASVDWTAIRARMDSLRSTVDGERRLCPQETAAVLAERARALAVPAVQVSDEVLLELIVFELAAERYAIESRLVIEVVGRVEAAFVPDTESPLVGLTAWRGAVVPLLDTRAILGLGGGWAPGSGQVLVLGIGRVAFGLIVDVVVELRYLPRSAIGVVPGATGNGRPFVHGATGDALLLLAGEDLIRAYNAGAVT